MGTRDEMTLRKRGSTGGVVPNRGGMDINWYLMFRMIRVQKGAEKGAGVLTEKEKSAGNGLDRGRELATGIGDEYLWDQRTIM